MSVYPVPKNHPVEILHGRDEWNDAQLSHNKPIPSRESVIGIGQSPLFDSNITYQQIKIQQNW